MMNGMNVEGATPGAYQQICMTLPQRSFTIQVCIQYIEYSLFCFFIFNNIIYYYII